MRRVLLTLGYLVLATGIIAAGVAIWGYAEYTRPGPSDVSRVVVVERGRGIQEIGGILKRAGVVQHAEVFVFGARVSGHASRLKAGEYRFPPSVSPREVVEILMSGRTVVRRITLVEGLTTGQVLDRIRASDGLFGTITRQPEEGSLLPETYHFSWGDTRDDLIGRMQKDMQDLLARLWPERKHGLPFGTPEEAVILASIIERETAKPDERAVIAGVFANRLHRGMKLQSDPTVAYGIAPRGLNRPMTRADTQKPTPFNTYVIAGLPPTPICNPGEASIRAALNPADVDYLYFVADGTGGHTFARTLAEHQRNVRNWRRLRDRRTGTEPAGQGDGTRQ